MLSFQSVWILYLGRFSPLGWNCIFLPLKFAWLNELSSTLALGGSERRGRFMRQNVFFVFNFQDFKPSHPSNSHPPTLPKISRILGWLTSWLVQNFVWSIFPGNQEFWKLTNSLYFLVETFHFFSIDPMRARAHPVSLLLPEEPKAVWTGKTPAEKALKMDTTGT